MYPFTLAVLVHQNETLSPLFALLTKGMFIGGDGPWGTSIWLWVRIVAPYAVVQSGRLALWLTGRSFEPRWLLLLGFAALMTLGGALLWKAGDLLYFMHAMGDLPGELDQFFAMEWRDLCVGTASTATACATLYLFLTGRRR